ncbi:hypothetical protein WSM22_31630 [Cytophagales bacterium WSM2-2]|nr:hypothetical protein WSM22_31630 [Cytophagales bacterium WSM2-2]
MESNSHILKAFPFLQRPGLEKELLENSSIMMAEKNEVIVNEGQYLKVLPLVISGTFRVFQTSEDREVLLYYVQRGETCMMSLTSCFFNMPSPSKAVAEEQTEILCVPTRFIQQWQRQYDEWNQFVIRTFQGRYNELLSSFNSVVFNNIEARIEDYLKTYVNKKQTDRVVSTHMSLANELGTTRVVVSRILKQMEADGKVELLRGEIRIIKL